MTIQLHLPDDLRQRLAARAAESGFATVEQFAEALLRAEADGEHVPDHVEAELTHRLDNPAPGIELTPEFEAAFVDEIRNRPRRRD